MKRILICGSNGLLGQRLSLMLSRQTEYEVLNTSHHRSFVFDHQLFDYTQLDITRKGDLKSLISSFHPHVILNAASATNVDWCETHREQAWNVNVVGVENLIEGARKVGAQIIHVSSDYVFDGRNGPYTEEDRPNPISYYGKSKLAAENAMRKSDLPFAIVRTIVLYGHGIDIKQNFPLWVIRSLKAGEQIRCVEDQISNPTYVGDLATAMVRIFEGPHTGLYHVCGSERISRYDFAVATAKTFALDCGNIQRVRSADLRQAAPRPLVTGFVIRKAEAELGICPLGIAAGLSALKHDIELAERN